MVTSRRERKCIDSSSAGRAGIFYCSSWRTVCWLPVPPPAGREDTQQHREGHGHVGSSSSTTWKPVDSTKQPTSCHAHPPPLPPMKTSPVGVTESPPPSSYGNGLSKSTQCKRLLRDVKDPRHFWGKHHSQRQQSRRGAVTRCQRHARRPTACEGKLQTPAQMCVVINTHTHAGARKRSDNNSQVSVAALCGADKTML